MPYHQLTSGNSSGQVTGSHNPPSSAHVCAGPAHARKNDRNPAPGSAIHGQAASPSTLGKELKVFSARLAREIQILKAIKPLAKFSGATGNFHTFDIVNSSIDWPKANKRFLKQFGIEQNLYTTQIEPHDWIAETSHSIVRINNILTDLSQDCWMYISNDIFKLKLNKNEVGSSTMPHKVNPIDFENAEGNFGISSALFEFFANKLTKSRHQRDLSDSTVLRNIGLGFGYSSLALSSTNKGLSKITPNFFRSLGKIIRSTMKKDSKSLKNAKAELSGILNAILNKKVCVMGRSIGSAPALDLCKYFSEITCCVIESGYADPIPLVKRRGLKISSITREENALYNNSEKIRLIKCPIFIMHGEVDTLISPEEAKLNYKNVSSQIKILKILKGVGHNDMLMAPNNSYFNSLSSFFAQVVL